MAAEPGFVIWRDISSGIRELLFVVFSTFEDDLSDMP